MNVAPPSPRRRSDAVRNEKKVRDAAEVVFRRRGKTLSMEEVAQEASVSKGTVYNVYGSRDLLIEELTIAYLRHSTASYRAAMAREDLWEGLIEAVLTPTMGVAATEDVMAPDETPSPVQEAFFDSRDTLGELLDLLKERGIVRPEITTNHVVTLFRGLYHVLPSYGQRDMATARELGMIILRGLRV